MKDLIVSATKKEIEPFLSFLSINKELIEGKLHKTEKFDIVITGIGILATAFKLGEILNSNKYNLILSFGIAGSFKEKFSIKSLVSVKQEILADFGSEDKKNNFKDIFEMGIMSYDTPPFSKGHLNLNNTEKFSFAEGLPEVTGVTVNRVLSHTKSVEWIKEKYNPDIVSMEGAAIFYAALLHSTNCIQIRSISDYVASEDRGKWDVKGSIQSLNDKIKIIYEQRYNIS